jgi:hypothetical protein
MTMAGWSVEVDDPDWLWEAAPCEFSIGTTNAACLIMMASQFQSNPRVMSRKPFNNSSPRLIAHSISDLRTLKYLMCHLILIHNHNNLTVDFRRIRMSWVSFCNFTTIEWAISGPRIRSSRMEFHPKCWSISVNEDSHGLSAIHQIHFCKRPAWTASVKRSSQRRSGEIHREKYDIEKCAKFRGTREFW